MSTISLGFRCLFWTCSRVMFQWLLVWTLSWWVRLVTWKTESCPSHELFFLLMWKNSCRTQWTRSYVHLVLKQDSFCWNVLTALLSCFSVWHCQQSWACVISGALGNSVSLSRNSSLSLQAPLAVSLSKDSLGQWLTMNDAAHSSILCKVSKWSSHWLLELESGA